MTIEAIPIETPITAVRQRGRWFAWIAWFYLFLTLGSWLTVRYAGDRFWPATLLLFAPRWPLLLPLILLLPMALFVRPRSLWTLMVAAALIAWPIMGLQLDRLPRGADASGSDLRVLTLNTHFQALNIVAMRAVIDHERPDVIALQEWYGGNGTALIGGNREYPYFLTTTIAFLASRYPIHFAQPPQIHVSPDDGIFYAYRIDYPQHPMTFYNVHLASPHGSLSETLHGDKYGVNRLRNNASARWSEAMHLRDLANNNGPAVMLAGDFNLPGDSPIFRTAFAHLTDAFSDAGLGYGWTYRTDRTDIRIDHILSGPDWLCKKAWVGPYVGSPHRPLLADYQFTGP